jgi:hypothetical protein
MSSVIIIRSPIDTFLWGVALTLGIFLSFLYYKRGRIVEFEWEKKFMFGFSGLFLFMGISRFFFLLSELMVDGYFINHTFYGDYNNFNPLHELFLRVCWISSILAQGIFFYVFEKFYRRTKYILTIIVIIFLVFITILPFEVATLFNNYIFVPILIFIEFRILFLFIKNSQPELKTTTPLILVGFMTSLFSIFLSDPPIRGQSPYFLYISPMFMIFGVLLISIPLIVNPKKLSKGLVYLIVGLSTVLFTSICIYIYFGLNFPNLIPIVFVISMLFTSFFYVYTFYKILKIIRSDKIIVKEKKIQSVLKMFSKPDNLSEEDIRVSKEKNICLVCKKKLVRDILMCECFTLYCEECSQNLMDDSEGCWVCDKSLIFPMNKDIRR